MIPDNKPARFCWLDLAAVDAGAAAGFYEGMFGWQATRYQANGGEIIRFMDKGESIASLYQLRSREVDSGVPSHWTPYIGVAGMEEAASKVEKLGGQVVVKPFVVDGIARVSLVVDSVGGLFGLWEVSK